LRFLDNNTFISRKQIFLLDIRRISDVGRSVNLAYDKVIREKAYEMISLAFSELYTM